MRKSASYVGLAPASARASAAARGASRKSDTRCEVQLRRALWRLGVRHRRSKIALPGKPDIVLVGRRTVIFCDGDFWHGRDLTKRLQKLEQGHNPGYWTEKIRKNVERDERWNATLRTEGWNVLRVWETDILRDADQVARDLLDPMTGDA